MRTTRRTTTRMRTRSEPVCACLGGQRRYSYFETHDVLPDESSVLWVMHCISGANCAGQLREGAVLRPQFPPRRRGCCRHCARHVPLGPVI
jgi:hypothetical protein